MTTKTVSVDFKKYLPETWPVLYVGLKNTWYTTKEVVSIINDNFTKLNCDEETLIQVNLNEDDSAAILRILKKHVGVDEIHALDIGAIARLIAIEKSELSIPEKLKEIALQWTRFDYPESWKGFIHYMPSESVNTTESVYQNFLAFLRQEQKRLNLSNHE